MISPAQSWIEAGRGQCIVAAVSFDAFMAGAALSLAILIGMAVMSTAYAGEWSLVSLRHG